MVDLLPASERILRALVLTPEPELADLPVRKLIERTGLSEPTIRRHIKRLRVLGYIATSRQDLSKPFSITVDRRAYQVLS